MEGDNQSGGPLKLFWSKPTVTAKLADLYVGEKGLDIKASDFLRAETMADEMKLPVGTVVGYAGVHLLAKCRRKDPDKPRSIEKELIKIQQDLLPSEGANSVGVQAGQVFLNELDGYVGAMEERYGKFTYQAFFRKAIADFWAYRKKTAEMAARRREMSERRKVDADDPEEKE